MPATKQLTRQERDMPMSLVVFISAAVLLSLYFSVTHRALHLYEGIIIWCFLIFIQNNFMWVVSIDLKLITMSDKVADHFVRDCIRSVLVPLMVMLFLEGISEAHKKSLQVLYWVLTVCLITGLEYAASFFQVIRHSDKWMVAWSFAFSASVVVLSFILFKVIRHIARKDVVV